MADSKKKNEAIRKGMKLTIVVEEASAGLVVVVLEHGDKVFRGVLLDATQRYGPVSMMQHVGTARQGYKGHVKSEVCEDESDEIKPVDVPATVFRHSYIQNTSPFKAYSHQDAPFPKIGGNKHTRNIRLRPRQTLCSNCKSTCLDSQKGPIPISSAVASNSSNQSQGSRQQNYLPQNTNKSNKTEEKYQSSRSSKRQKDVDSGPKPTKLIKVHNDPPKLTRTSPFIKISIGETNVMNIPPRLQESDKEELSSEAEKYTDVDEKAPVLENEDDDDVDDEVIFNFKPSLMRQKQETWENKKKKKGSNNERRNRKLKHKQDSDSEMPNIIITENIDSEDEKMDGSQNVTRTRPRLVYTLQARRCQSRSDTCTDSDSDKAYSSTDLPSSQYENLDGTSVLEPNNTLNYKSNKKRKRKIYKLRSRSRSADSNPEFQLAKNSSESDQRSLSGQSDGCASTDSDLSEYGDGPPGDENTSDCLKPLMMKIHTTSVSKCSTTDGRKLHVEDIVWGKVKGFPWWPGRVMAINVSQKDNGVVLRQIAQVAWFGSSTMSHITCSDLFPFLEHFKVRFNRKKKSTPYRRAIKQATLAAQSCNADGDYDVDDIDFSCIS